MTIAIYYNDHLPPHIHIAFSGFITRIEIETGEYMRGNEALPRAKEKIVLKWLDTYNNDIMKAWDDCMAKRQPKKVPPLS